MTELPIPIEALEDCGVALGRRGAGKSNALMVLFEHELDAGHRCGMVDPKGDRWGVAMNPDGSPSRFRDRLRILGGSHADVVISPDMGGVLAKLIANHDFPFLIDLSGTPDEPWTLGQQQRFMLDFSSGLYRHNRSPITLFLEEIDQFANQDQRYQPPKLVHHVSNLASLGRQRGIIVWMASQRAAKVSKNLLNMVDTMIAMGVRSPLDRDTFADWFKGHSPEAAKRVLAEVGSFGPGEAFAWIGGAGFFEKVQFPLASTFDSGRTPKHGEKVEKVTLAKIDLGDLRSALEQAGLEEPDTADPKVVAELQATIARLKPLADQAQQARAWHTASRARITVLEGLISRYRAGIGAMLDVAQDLASIETPPDTGMIESLPATGGDGPAAPASPQGAPSEARAPAKRRSPAAEAPPETLVPRSGGAISTGNSVVFGAAGELEAPKGRALAVLGVLAGLSASAPNGGVTEKAWSFMAHVDRKSSTWRGHKAALRGFFEEEDGRYRLSAAGEQLFAGESVMQGFGIGENLVRQWIARIKPAGAATILESLLEAYPKSLTRAQLGEATKAAIGSSTFRGYLAPLNTLELIEKDGQDYRLARDLMEW